MLAGALARKRLQPQYRRGSPLPTRALDIRDALAVPLCIRLRGFVPSGA